MGGYSNRWKIKIFSHLIILYTNIHPLLYDLYLFPSLPPPLSLELTIFKEESNDNIGMDVTNKTVILSIQSTNIKFRAMSSTPNPFLNKMEPEWIFSKTGTLPHAVQQSSYMLTFDSILRSREQEGTYTITFGNYTASFTLHTRGV